MEQRFDRNGDLKAVGFVKGLFRTRERNIPPAEVAARIDMPAESPPMPESIRAWRDAEKVWRA
jgi:hypothetical protein